MTNPSPSNPPGSSDASPYQVAVEEEAAWQRRLTITVAPERIGKARGRERKKLAKTVRIKGFRKGKVPTHIIEENRA